MENNRTGNIGKDLFHCRRGMSQVASEEDGKGLEDSIHEGRDEYDMEVDRMVNEGLGGGQVTFQNGWVPDIEETLED
jgi:hypothetical protein